MKLKRALAVCLALCWPAAALAQPLPVGGRVASLLAEPLRLHPNRFDNSSQACTSSEVLRATFPAFALPTNGPQLSVLLQLTAVDCSGVGMLLALGGSSGGVAATPAIDLALDCPRRLLLFTSSSGLLSYQLPKSPAAGVALMLQQDVQSGSFQVCADGSELLPAPGAGGQPIFQLLGGSSSQASSLLGPAVVFGARTDAARSARADIESAFVVDSLIPCSSTQPGAPMQELVQQLSAASGTLASPPAVAVVQQPASRDAAVGEAVQLSITATPSAGAAGSLHRLRATLFGLAPKGCTAAECGDQVLEAAVAPAGQPVQLDASVSYPKPGRYVIRVEVTDMRGTLHTHDHTLLVRKLGDPALDGRGGAGAPCCRHSPGVVAQQLGRPISDTRFRDATAAAQAAAVGWAADNVQHEDLEAERLFDYSVLAPLPSATPLVTATCHDTWLAGAGSSVILGNTDAAPNSRGRNKRLAIVPAGYSWATSPNQIACQKHWSGWQASSPYTLPANDGSGGVCSAVCTRDGMLQLMRETGMFDQYNQALIQASYGSLSLSADVAVLPEVYLPYNADVEDNFTYYEAPAVEALAAAGEAPWMFLMLVPLANHRMPPFRAWSGGRAAGGAVITQCYPTLYYAVHETGHRMGFRHANMYQLEGHPTAPANPLGPGATTVNGYSDPLDIMACCKGDYGLYYRTMAGWLRGGPAERAVLLPADLATPGTRRIALWPFDRPESRGRLLSLAIRRSEDEVLLVGFRSAPHWQDVSIDGGQLAPDQSRHSVRGITVELVRRNPQTGQWADHRGTLDFNLLKGDWPDALPAPDGNGFPRNGAFAALKEGQSWHDPATRLLLSFEAIGGCPGAPGLPLYNHSARDFYGFRGEFPQQEAFERADYTGFHGLECAQLVLTTAAPEPTGRLSFSVEAAPADTSAAPILSRRRLHVQPAERGDSSIAAEVSAEACGVPAAPVLRLRLPAGQRLSSVIWKDGLNRTIQVESGASLAAAADAAAAAGADSWTTAAVALPAQYPIEESSGELAPGCFGSLTCQQAQRQYRALVLASDGRHTSVAIQLAPGNLLSHQISLSYKHYEPNQLTYEQGSLLLPHPGASSLAGVALYGDSAAPLQLAHAGGAVVSGGSLPDTHCSRQWSLTSRLRISADALQAATQSQDGRVLLLVDGGYPSISLGLSQLPASAAAPVALWLGWGSARRRLALPRTFSWEEGLHLVLVRDGSRVGLWANGRGKWLVRDLGCLPSRPTINYCDTAAQPVPFTHPAELRFGRAAGGEPVEATLTWARFYSYALPEPDVPAEAVAAPSQLQQYFRLASAAPLLACQPGTDECASGSKPGGLPLPILAAAGAGGAVAVAAIVGGCCWWRRRRARRQMAAAAALDRSSAESGSSCKSAA